MYKIVMLLFTVLALKAGPVRDPWRIGAFDVHASWSEYRPCLGVDVKKSWHAGEDWFAPPGSPVYSVGEGIVRFVSDGSYPGLVLILEHALPGGEPVYFMYGHIARPALVDAGQVVAQGEEIGALFDWGTNSHLHLEARAFLSAEHVGLCGTVPGPGYTYPQRPRELGYLPPSEVLEQGFAPLSTLYNPQDSVCRYHYRRESAWQEC